MEEFPYESNWVSHLERVFVQTKLGSPDVMTWLAVINFGPCSHTGGKSVPASGNHDGAPLRDPFRENLLQGVHGANSPWP